MASRRRRAKPARKWWAVLTAALVATLVVVYWPSPSQGPDSTQAAKRLTATASAGPGAATVGASASATPSASPSATPKHSAGPSASAGSPSAKAGAKATTKGTSGAGTAGGTTDGSAAGSAPAGQRSITLVNHTQQTVWAIVTGTSAYPGGKELQPGQSASLTVGNTWGGRIWGRTGCSAGGQGQCLTGDCTSQCSGANPPTTLGEFTFDAYDDLDFYDVSMVDGSNLPMYINVSHTVTADPVSASGCYKGTCTTAVNCPGAMQATSGSQVVGCKPPCAAFGGDTYCCRGAWAGRDNCVPSKWPVDYTQVFKKAEPYAYSYAFDDSATMACKGACYYRVTFGTSG